MTTDMLAPRPRLDIPAGRAALPAGYRYGAHVSGGTYEGYYVIRESDGASCVARIRPDIDADDMPDAEAIDEAIDTVRS